MNRRIILETFGLAILATAIGTGLFARAETWPGYVLAFSILLPSAFFTISIFRGTKGVQEKTILDT